MEDFKVVFKGTRGSYPVPNKNFLKYGGNTPCVLVKVAGHLIILDAGTGIIDLGHDLMREYIISGETVFDRKPVHVTLFLSHLHQDHIHGLPFFDPLHVSSSKINIFGLNLPGEDLKKTIVQTLFEKTFPVNFDDIGCNVSINNFSQENVVILKQDGNIEFCEIGQAGTIQNDDVIITAHKISSHPKNGSLSFRIQYKNKSIVYATDKENNKDIDSSFVNFAKDADLLIHDAQYTEQEYTSPISLKQGFGHSTFQMAIENFKLSNAKKLVFFHYDPNYDDITLKNLEADFKKITDKYLFAKENLEIEI